ncbi:MAG: sodium:calcium antiporter [Pirellulales bacterium]|jgi:cation:H+ antiporter
MSPELYNLIGWFIGLSILIIIAGYFLAGAANVIGEKSGMGASLAGLVLLAAATSLPEFAININAVRLPDAISGVNLSMGNVLGSSLFNLFILAVIDLLFRSKQRMLSSVSSAHALSALASISLTAIVLIFLALGNSGTGLTLSWGHLGFGTLGIGLFYVFSIRLIYYDQQVAAELVEDQSEPAKMSLGLAIAIYLVCTGVIFFAASRLAPTADNIASLTGLGGTFFGSTFLALVTSLPELVTTYAAVRMGAADMALGNILGSNSFNIAILLPVDMFYTRGSILADADPVHAVTAGAVIFINCIATMGILYKSHKRHWIIEPDAALIVMLVIASLWGIYQLTNEDKTKPPAAESEQQKTALYFESDKTGQQLLRQDHQLADYFELHAAHVEW